ncbi:MAG: trehalose-phosphatase [Actinomycetota bacterium]
MTDIDADGGGRTEPPTVTPPSALAATIEQLPRPRLLVFDCDGVLAPIVEHADDAVLRPGVREALARLALREETRLAVLSGRSLAGLAQFDFPSSVDVVGSYGSERRGHEGEDLDDDRAVLLAEIGKIAAATATAADGAWVEHKPASVVLHVRGADPDAGAVALRRIRDEAERLHGVFVHEGKAVVELAVHSSDKGAAIAMLIDDHAPAAVVYLGDDEPDEAAFRIVEQGPTAGIAVRVGPAPTTVASRLLADTDAVLELLEFLAPPGA